MAPVPDPNNSATDDSKELGYIGGPQVIEVSSGSDSDSDVEANDGYVQLAQGPDTVDTDSSDSEGEVEVTANTDTCKPSTAVLDMPEEQADEIKAVMANIKLPNIPSWAKQIPEEQWMSSLMENLMRKKGEGHQTDSPSASTSAGISSASASISEQSNSGNTTACITHSPPLFEVNFEEHFPTS